MSYHAEGVYPYPDEVFRQTRSIHFHQALGSFQRKCRAGFPLKGTKGQVEVYTFGLPSFRELQGRAKSKGSEGAGYLKTAN